MVATIAGLLAGGTASIFALPYVIGGLTKVMPKKTEGFGLFEVIAGGGTFLAGVIVAGIVAGLVHYVLPAKIAGTPMTAKV